MISRGGLKILVRLVTENFVVIVSGALLISLAMLGVFGLLTTAGWFICACYVAGIGAHPLFFNYMLPSSGVRAFAALKVIGQYIARWVTHSQALDILTQWRLWLFDVWSQGVEPKDCSSSERLHTAIQDIDAIGFFSIEILMPAIALILITLLYWGLLVVTLPLSIAMMAMLSITGVMFITMGLVYTMMFKVHRAQNDAAITFKAKLIDLIRHVVPLIVDQAITLIAKRCHQQMKQVLQHQYHIDRLTGWVSALVRIIEGALVIALLAALYVGSIKISLLTLGLLLFATLAYFELGLPWAINLGQKLTVLLAAERLATRSLVQSVITAERVNKPAIQLSGVHFSYDKSHPVLIDLSLTIPWGQKVLIRAPSGSGKSTVLKLIKGLYCPQEGHCQIFPEQTTLIEQSPYFYQGSLRQNLMMGDGDINDQKINRVLSQLNLLHCDLDQAVWSDSSHYSKGQLKRLALARALLNPRPIILLDEPMAHLDAQTRAMIWPLLFDLESTVVIASHIVDDEVKFDQIVSLEWLTGIF